MAFKLFHPFFFITSKISLIFAPKNQIMPLEANV